MPPSYCYDALILKVLEMIGPVIHTVIARNLRIIKDAEMPNAIVSSTFFFNFVGNYWKYPLTNLNTRDHLTYQTYLIKLNKKI